MKVTIRNYQEADREQCRSLWRQLVEWHREIYHDPKIGGEHPECYFDKHLSLVGNQRLWVALYGSKIVGLVGLVVKGDEAEIEPVVVNKDYRCKSIGKQLVERVISEAHQMGTKYLDVSPVARNLETIGFFYKLGFVNLGKIEMFMDFTSRHWKSGLKLDGYEFNF
jgi:ribosomal protein S18 acetylase RimI-like enzyme